MARYSEHLDLPYAAGQLFALVADIERYPEFVPAYAAARVIDRTDARLKVDQVLRMGSLRLRFRSIATLDPPHGIRIRAERGPFGRLDIDWSFREIGEGRTQVGFAMTAALRNPLFDRVFNILGPRLAQRTVRAFVARAHALYGREAGAAA